MTRIAFIGLGNMGLPMAKNLLAAGHAVAGFDVASANLDALADVGGTRAASAGDAVAEAEVVITMLPAGQHVRQVYTGEGGVLARAPAGALLVDCSTVDVETARAVAQVAADQGFDMLDAPVSGGTVGAAAGTLTFMVGGGESAFERAKPILAAMGKTIVHAGGPGNGQGVKICNNMVLGVSMIAVAEAFSLADRLGIDHQTFFDISSKASGQCWSLTTYCPVPGPVPTSPANRDYKPGFAVDMMLKDLKLAQQTAAAVSAPTPLGGAAAAVYQLLSTQGQGGMDFSAVYKMLAGK